MTVRFELFVADTTRATAFYRDGLGFDVAAEFDADGATYVELRNGNAIIGVQREDAVAPPLLSAHPSGRTSTAGAQRVGARHCPSATGSRAC